MNAAPATSVFRPAAAWFREHAPLWILIGIHALLFAALHGRFGELIVDCSREATLPWRILRGEVLYRDFNCEYGPLAPYFLALCYRILGVRLPTLELAGCLISTAVATMAYVLSRVFLDRGRALAVGLFFVLVFAFQFCLGHNIFNYVFPYAYSASIGVLLLLLSFFAGHRFLATGRSAWLSWLGLFYALAWLTKVEFILAQNAFALVLLPFLLPKMRREPFPTARTLARRLGAFLWPAVLILPPVVLYFASQLDIPAYLRNEVFGMADFSRPAIRSAMGVDYLRDNLLVIGVVMTVQILLGLLFFGADWLAPAAERRIRSRPGRVLLGSGLGICLAALAATAAIKLFPLNVFAGMSVWLPLIGAGALWALRAEWRAGPLSARTILVLAMAATSFTLLGRILINARPVGYGVFFLLPGTLLFLWVTFGILPAFFRRRGVAPRFFTGGFLVFFAAAALGIFSASWKNYGTRRFELQTPRGTMHLPQDQGEAMRALLEFFKDKRGCKVLVLPEGNLINFLLDSPPATYSYAYVPALLDTPAKEDRIIRELREKPIDYILIVTRWTTEFGCPIVGVDYAQRLKQAIDADYRGVAQFGPPPFNEQGIFGILVLERKSGAE